MERELRVEDFEEVSLPIAMIQKAFHAVKAFGELASHKRLEACLEAMNWVLSGPASGSRGLTFCECCDYEGALPEAIRDEFEKWCRKWLTRGHIEKLRALA